jgi:hypothetical protein
MLKGRDDMFCSNCGKQVEGSNFCPYCGAEVHKNQQPNARAPEVPRTRSKKGRVWAVIGIIAGVVIITAAALFFIFTHAVEGQWYSKERGEVLVFGNDGTIDIKRLCGTGTEDFEYDRLTGKGSFDIGSREYDFTADASKMDIGDIGVFRKADSGFDINEFFDEYGNLGTWYSEERGEVLVFDRDGTLQSEHTNCVNDADYEYDRKRGTGEISFDPFSYEFQIDDGQLRIEGMGVFTEADNSFDTDDFLREFGDSVLGIWYDAAGEAVIDLHADGTYDLESFGRSFKGEYTNVNNDITITYKYINIDIGVNYILKNGVINIDISSKCDINKYVRENSEQKGIGHFYDEAVGKWISENGDFMLEFFDDGYGALYNTDDYFTGTYKYEPLGNMGYLNLVEEDDLLFLIFGDHLILLETTFYKVD